MATRNLWLPAPALALAFAVWMLWSVLVVRLPAAGFNYSTNQLFWLTALPALCGATLRIFYAFAAPVLGGRRFRTLTTASLLLPAIGIGLALQEPGTPYEFMVALALLCGLGGLGGLDGLDGLSGAQAGFAEQAAIFTRKHNWLMCWLVLGSLGSFIGFSAGLPLLMQSQFHRDETFEFAWPGPLIGALLWPLGRGLASRFGGGRVTFWAFVVMAVAAAVVLQCLPQAGPQANEGRFPGFLAGFGMLFAAAGIGNGSTLRMIPTLFLTAHQRSAGPLPSARTQAAKEGEVEAAAVLGFASAIGAYGGFFIPKSFGTSIAVSGSAAPALQLFIAFYLSCIALTWWFYSRRNAPVPC